MMPPDASFSDSKSKFLQSFAPACTGPISQVVQGGVTEQDSVCWFYVIFMLLFCIGFTTWVRYD